MEQFTKAVIRPENVKLPGHLTPGLHNLVIELNGFYKVGGTLFLIGSTKYIAIYILNIVLG